MSFNADSLMQLLPAVHRIRDAEIAEKQGLSQGPLQNLMVIIAEQIAIVEESLEQGYDDLFVETCNDWVVPYIGDLIGYESLHGNVPDVASPRAEVAHTIALRRRKGTIVVLEQLARDVTDWDARAVEYFQTLGWTQHTNHIRANNFYAPDLRKQLDLERIATPFNKASFTTEVRRVESSRGKHNIPNIGIHLWRIDAYRHSQMPAIRLAERRYLVSPLGNNTQLYSRPIIDDGFIKQLSDPLNVPEPLSRRQTHEKLADYYGFRQSPADPVDNDEPSIVLYVNNNEIAREQILICNLSDHGAGWAHEMPNGFYGIDPVLGRVALPAKDELGNDIADPADVQVTWHKGFSADLGGGEYDRQNSLSDASLATNYIQMPHPDYATLQDAIDDLNGEGIVEVADNALYQEALTIDVNPEATIELRARNDSNPTLLLTDDLRITGAANSRFVINGFCITGDRLLVENTGSNELRELVIEHCILVPGITLNQDGSPQTPEQENLNVEIEDLSVYMYRCISGPIRMTADSHLYLEDCIVDANDPTSIALSAPDVTLPGPVSTIKTSTLVGKVYAREFPLVSDSILLARLAEVDSWNAPVWAERKQSGCIRFSFLPFESIVPRRFRCQPDSVENARLIAPRFTSLSFGQAAYCQLAAVTNDLIRRGAEDESEMGVFHHLYAPQRETNLTIRLREYLRVGLQAGIFYQS